MLFFQLGLPVPPTPRQRSFCHQRGKTLAKTLRLHVAALVLLSFLSGCSLSPLAKRTADFSSAAAATSIDTASAYQIVERAHYDTEVATLVANYDTDGFHPEKIKPFLKPEDQETRTRILNGLTQYAETLAEVSGDQPLADVDKQAAVLGNSLKDLSKSGALAPLAKSADTELNIAAAALDALGRALIEHRRDRKLPDILKQMKDPIQQICDLLWKDIGDPEKSGLRNQLKNDYATLIRKQTDFITDSKNLTAGERRAAIAELPKMLAAQADGDRTLAATQDALKQLALTHAALADTAAAKDAPGFKALLSALVEDGIQLHGFYEKQAAR